MLIGFQVGARRQHKTDGYGGHAMDLQVHYRPMERVATWLVEAGFVIEAEMVQGPGEQVPHGRVLARLPKTVHRTRLDIEHTFDIMSTCPPLTTWPPWRR